MPSSPRAQTIAICELIAVACLAVQGLDAQLRAHLMGARNVGASTEAVADTLHLAAELSGQPLDGAFAQLDQIASRLSSPARGLAAPR